MPEKPQYDSNATIQLELDQVQLAEAQAALRGSRSGPPPLPASAAPPSSLGPSAAPASPWSKRKTVGVAVVFLALLGVAIGAGAMVGAHARGSATATGSPSTTASGAEVPAASASSQTLTIPTVEIR